MDRGGVFDEWEEGMSMNTDPQWEDLQKWYERERAKHPGENLPGLLPLPLYPAPAVCPGCGRCQHCGQPSWPTQPHYIWTTTSNTLTLDRHMAR
jgi:hypothetical protein